MNTHILLGTNLGDREGFLKLAIELIEQRVGRVTRKSPIYETQSWGYQDNDYLNQVIVCETTLSPEETLKATSRIENELGRIRDRQGYQARTIDIDILLCGSEVVDSPTLTVPHPRMQERKFVLIPMCQLDGDLMHPTINKTMNELLQQCTDNCNVKPYKQQ